MWGVNRFGYATYSWTGCRGSDRLLQMSRPARKPPCRPSTLSLPQQPSGSLGDVRLATAVIVSQGSQAEDRAAMFQVQALFSPLPATVLAIQTTITTVRFNRYLLTARNDPVKALELYRWNSFLSHSLYWPIQTLEVGARNSISAVLTNRFGKDWHTSDKIRRLLSREDVAKLDETILRQQRERGARYPSADMIVADLPFGFWTSMLTAHYAIPLNWQRNLPVAFPHMPAVLPLRSVLRPMESVRVLRNRIAHHEPIFDRRLDLAYREILQVLGWICPASQWYVEQTSLFPATWAACPIHDVRGAAMAATRRR